MENKKKSCGEYIKIHTDGRNTIAQLYDDNAFRKFLGEAVARCHPDDEFDLATGAKLAIDRLFAGKESRGEFIGFRGLSTDPNHLRLVGEWAENITDPKIKEKIVFPNGVTSYESELDKVFPFNKIRPVYDVYGNRLIKFPKCYIRWTDTVEGYIDGFDVAAEKISDDFFLPDCFIVNGKEIPAIYIGAYEASENEETKAIESKAGKTVLTNISHEGFAKRFTTMPQGYEPMSVDERTLYNFLVMLYLQTAFVQDYFTGCTRATCAVQTGTASDRASLCTQNNTTGACSLLRVENPFGNVCEHLYEIDFKKGDVYYRGANTGIKLPRNGYCKQWKHGDSENTRSLAMPCATSDESAPNADFFWSWGGDTVVLNVGGTWASGAYAGLWFSGGPRDASLSFSYVGGRLVYRPL